MDDGVKSAERLLEQKRRVELSDRIASGDFTVEQSGYAFNNIECTTLLLIHVPSHSCDMYFTQCDENSSGYVQILMKLFYFNFELLV